MYINAIGNKSEILTIWQNVIIVFKQIIVVQILLNVELCHFALICTLLRANSLCSLTNDTLVSTEKDF